MRRYLTNPISKITYHAEQKVLNQTVIFVFLRQQELSLLRQVVNLIMDELKEKFTKRPIFVPLSDMIVKNIL